MALSKTALAVPTASATPKAATRALAETITAEMGETYAVIDATTHAMAEAVAEMSETCVVMEATTQAMFEAVVQFAVLVMAQPTGSVRIAVPVIAIILLALRDASVSRIVGKIAGTSVRLRLRSGRLRSNRCSHRQPNDGSQQNSFGRKPAAGHRSLLLGICPTVLANSEVGDRLTTSNDGLGHFSEPLPLFTTIARPSLTYSPMPIFARRHIIPL
jgi:hypothetical protein